MIRDYGMKPSKSSKPINPDRYGVSFSVKQCRNFSLDSQETLDWLIKQGWRRFRLMSYWNEIELEPGKYDFVELDRQIKQVRQAGGIVSLCLGVKQPRWPEYHWPKWALGLSSVERDQFLIRFVETVVKRYRVDETVTSWQLENEALLKGFGQSIIIDRARLRAEFKAVKKLDPARPIIMSTSNGWGVPFRQPRPDLIGFSYYLMMHQNGRYSKSIQRPWLHRLRKTVSSLIIKKPVFIHELQLEPWGPEAIWKMSSEEQAKSMNPSQIYNNIRLALTIKASPIDLWGGEWWYWRYKQNDLTIWQAVEKSLRD